MALITGLLIIIYLPFLIYFGYIVVSRSRKVLETELHVTSHKIAPRASIAALEAFNQENKKKESVEEFEEYKVSI